MTARALFVAFGCCAAAACAVTAAPVYQWEFAANLSGLSQPIASDDLINGIVPLRNPELSYAGNPFFEYPFGPNHWDPVTNPDGYHPINNLGDPCRLTELPEFPDIAYDDPNIGISGFHPATSPGCQNGSCLTDGIAGRDVDSVLTDFAYPAGVFQFDLPQPTDIGEIRVFAANPYGRVFQDYDVYVSTDTNPEPRDREFTLLIHQVLSADIVKDELGNPIGLFPNGNPAPPDPAHVEASMTTVKDDAGGALATGVTSIRFVFWAVSNTARAFYDRYRGTTGPDPCTGDPDALDIDGNRRAFEAPVIKEIDVFGPPAPPCATPAQDADADGDVDVNDFAVFQLCFNGSGRPWPTELPGEVASRCQCMDQDDDLDVDVNDFAIFQLCFNGTARPPAPDCP